MIARWIWLPLLLTLAVLVACGSSGSTAAVEELPQVYNQALADEDWSQVWDLFSAETKEICTFDYFIQSRDWFKEQSGDDYGHWLDTYRQYSESDWDVNVSGDTAILTLLDKGVTIDAVLEDGVWRISQSGEYQTCIPFRP